jgi:hypothetical protein
MSLFRRHIVLLLLLAISLGNLIPPPAMAADDTVIAYVSSSRENQQIRMIDPDHGTDRLVWSVLPGTARDSGIGTLSWRPDGTEIAFDSGHDWERSLLTRDLYGVRPSGGGLRRITSPPGPINTAALPTGTVTLRVENYAGGKDLSAYIDGAPGAIQFTAAIGSAWEITFVNVPDFWPGVRQYARIYNHTTTPFGHQCWFDPGAFADVQPGQTVAAGQLTTLQETNCPFAFQPTWNSDGTAINYLLRDSSHNINRPTNIWQIGANPEPTSIGDQILDMGQFLTSDKLYLVARGPAPAQHDQLLFVQNGTLNTPIYLGSVADLATAAYIDVGECPRTVCKVTGLAWLPDGSGFVFSRVESGPGLTNPPPEGGALFQYSFVTQQTEEILRLPDEVIGKLSLAPDGATIAFERALQLDESVSAIPFGPRALCPCSLWLVGRDGSSLRQLVSDGRAPAWSPVAPPPEAAAQPSTIWLPLVRR